jgi:hypothetical protein
MSLLLIAPRTHGVIFCVTERAFILFNLVIGHFYLGMSYSKNVSRGVEDDKKDSGFALGYVPELPNLVVIDHKPC